MQIEFTFLQEKGKRDRDAHKEDISRVDTPMLYIGPTLTLVGGLLYTFFFPDCSHKTTPQKLI